MMDTNSKIKLIGYSDKLSVRSGEFIEFKVSSHARSKFQTRLTRLISADPNPDGVGIIEENCDTWYSPQKFDSRVQPFFPGSYAVSDKPIKLSADAKIIISANIFATLNKPCKQTILSFGDLSLAINAEGFICFYYATQTVAHNISLPFHRWMHLIVTFDFTSGEVEIRQSSINDSTKSNYSAAKGEVACSLKTKANKFHVAAELINEIVVNHFNGKIENPSIQVLNDPGEKQTLIAWDFSKLIPSTKVCDISPNAYHGSLINFPMRAVTGSNWNAKEMCWRHATDQYRAIHFHDDDIYDFNWQTDFKFQLPPMMPSGIYVMHIEAEGEADAMPFFVCAAKGNPTAKVCVIIPTFTYIVYGNHARPDYHESWQQKINKWGGYPHNPANHRNYGLSTYNFHSDGSGIAHASHLRPLFNLRPGFLTFGYGEDSGLRHLQADTHLISWLHAKKINYDIITDHELHAEGIDTLKKYDKVLTTTHPEYHTFETLNTIEKYTAGGGHFLYLGGNGFYWRIALHKDNKGIIEIRRTEGGIRAWESSPGEYYSAFDGLYGGLWRRMGCLPQQLVGVGFAAQGNFTGSFYRRKCFDEKYNWIFAGIDGEIIGDFGLSGGGAAGFELDRADARLGTPENAVVLASSEGHDADFILAPEERLTHLTNIAGQKEEELLHADIVYFTMPNGGSVFAVGSITFCGSLPCNNFNNSVSQLLMNVLCRV